MCTHIGFNHTIQTVSPCGSSSWRVAYLDREGNEHTEILDAVMVANGHHWNAKYPEFEGHFDGKLMHSHNSRE